MHTSTDGATLLMGVLVSKFVLVETDEALLEGELNCSSMFLHVTFKADKFTKNMYVSFLHIWIEVREYLLAQGISEVFSLVSKDEKIMKWQTMFGMEKMLEFQDKYLYRSEL